MKWLSSEETDTVIQGLPDQPALFDAYALSLFADRALYTSDFLPSDVWGEAIAPSEGGRQLMQALSDAGHNSPAHIQLFTLFRLFYHRDLLIDYQATDFNRLLAELAAIHAARQACWPYVFGNGLYHKFNDSYDGNRTDSLEADDAHQLLKGTPQGVFQLGHILSGPLGFLRSEEERSIPPTLSLPLWHCSDPGCEARHFVQFRQHKMEYTAVKNAYVRYIIDNLGQPSGWHKPILRISRRDRWPNGRPYNDLPAVVADCLIGSERTALCVRAFRSPHNRLLADALRKAGRKGASPEEMAQALSPEEQHQLLLLLPDQDLVHMIDELVCRQDVRIPPSELRQAKTYSYGHSGDYRSQVSSLGIRSTGHPPLIELTASVWNTYEALGLTDDLIWRVRGHA